MLKKIIIQLVLIIGALAILPSQSSAQATAADQEDFRAVLADHIGESVTNSMLVSYMESSENNVTFLRTVQNAQKNNARYNEAYFNNLIAGMEAKLGSNNARSNNQRKKE